MNRKLMYYPERVQLTTVDQKHLSAHVYDAGGEKYALLLHMMPATQESWEGLALALRERGISSLAFDQRGHGESDGGPEGYKDFTNVEQQEKVKDVEAALLWLKGRGATYDNIVPIGASIGANLAIWLLGREEMMPCGVALSPGLDYHGVVTEPAVWHLKRQKLLIIASDDDEYSYKSSQELHEANPECAEFLTKSSIGHGTTMMENDSALVNQVADWVKARV